MRLLTMTAASTALLITTSAQAGGLSDQVMEAPVVVQEPMMEPAGSSINPAFIVVGILAALLLASSLEDDDDNGTDLEDLASDINLKQDIFRVGTALNGLPIYSFGYIGQEGTYLGVMAQDVVSHTPEAVSVGEDGYMRVNYGMLGMRMVRLD